MRAPAFGQFLRGARLGYFWSEEHRAFIRMSDAGPNFYVEAAPFVDGKDKSLQGMHRVWWEGPDRGRAVLAACKPLVGLRSPTEKRTWVVNHKGEALP